MAARRRDVRHHYAFRRVYGLSRRSALWTALDICWFRRASGPR